MPHSSKIMSNQYRKFSESEINRVKAKYSSLSARKEGYVLVGLLEFVAEYEDRNKKKLELRDEYEVKIKIGEDSIPHVWETGGRLQKRADKLGKKDIRDMHVYPNTKWKICMGTVLKMKEICVADSTIEGIFNNLIIRYFYYHTYWERQGVEPWDGLKHGDAGIIEEYIDNPASGVFEYSKYLSPELLKYINIRKISRAREMCICNNYKIKECSCGIMEKYSIFQKNWIAYKSKHKK